MIFYQTLKGRLQDGADTVTATCSRFGEFCTVIVGYAAYEMDGREGRGDKIVIWGQGDDVPTEELLEAVEQKIMDGGMFPMTRTEWTEWGKVAVWHGSAVNTLYDVCLCLMGFIEKELTDVVR